MYLHAYISTFTRINTNMCRPTYTHIQVPSYAWEVAVSSTMSWPIMSTHSSPPVQPHIKPTVWNEIFILKSILATMLKQGYGSMHSVEC